MATKKAEMEPATGTSLTTTQAEWVANELKQAFDALKSSGEYDELRAAFDLLEADGIDDILGSSVIHLTDIVGTPFTIKSLALNDSDYESSVLPAFAAVNVEFDDGSSGVVTTGAVTVVLQLIALWRKGHIPGVRTMATSATTSKGYTVYRLVKVPD